MDESKFSIPNKIERNKKINYRCPRWAATKMLKGGLIKKKYGLKSFQELFDYLIVSGVVYLKPKILEFLKKEMPKYREQYIQNSLAKLGKAEAPEGTFYNGYMQLQAYMYEQDFHQFNNFCIENNVKPVWVYHCMFVDGFVAEHSDIIELIEECKAKNIKSRKNTVARLTKDKYVDVLSTADCTMLLTHLTKKFESKEFDVNLISEISKLNESLEDAEEKDEVTQELNLKLESIKESREKELEDATEPVFEVEGLTNEKAALKSRNARKT